MNSDWECLVVGGGVAGLSAALVLGRARRRTLLLDAGGQSNRAAEHVGGLIGQDGTTPDELYALGRRQLDQHDSVVVQDAEVVGARVEGEGFAAVLGDGEEVGGRVLILATGMDYEVPDLPDFAAHWGRGVFHCPFCHGWEVRGRRLVVCGTGRIAEQQAALLRGWTDGVTVVDPDDVAGLRAEDGEVQALRRRDGSEVTCEGVLVHAPLRLRGSLAEQLGLALTDAGLIEVDGHGGTGVPGVYAAGDVAVSPQQVAIAIGSGHMAGVMAVRELLLGRG